jgi:hypothetical protein
MPIYLHQQLQGYTYNKQPVMIKTLILSLLCLAAAVPVASKAIPDTTPAASDLLAARIQQAVNAGHSCDAYTMSAYLHVFITDDGSMRLLGLYCPCTLMQRHIMKVLGGRERKFTHDLPSGHYTFRLSLNAV